MSEKPEIYVSTDVETDGRIPGKNSMLSLGSVAFNEAGEELSEHLVNLVELPPPARGDDETMEWWKTQPAAWCAIRRDLVAPKPAMKRYREWVESLPGKPVFVGYPAGFDFTFVYWYLIYFTDGSPFSFSCIDIKSYAMALLKKGYRHSAKKYWPESWKQWKEMHTHIPTDDAREQGLAFMQMRRENHAESSLLPGV